MTIEQAESRSFKPEHQAADFSNQTNFGNASLQDVRSLSPSSNTANLHHVELAADVVSTAQPAPLPGPTITEPIKDAAQTARRQEWIKKLREEFNLKT